MIQNIFTPPGRGVEGGLAVTVLEVDLELRPGEEILVDPGLAVPEHRESQTFILPSLLPHFSPDRSPQSIPRPAVDVDFLLDGQHQEHHVPVLAGQEEVVLEAEEVGGHFLNLSVSQQGPQGSIVRGTMS